MESTLTLRQAGTGDEAAIARVAALDSSRPPVDPAMVAERDGRIVAAISFDDGAVVADPFERTADVVQALRLRREQVTPARRRGTLRVTEAKETWRFRARELRC
jgi:hypothetical protein